MKYFLSIIVIVFYFSFHAKSQISDCKGKGGIYGILACINTVPELKNKYGYKRIITYRAKNRLSDYKQNNYYSIHEYIDSTHSVSSKSYRNGKITPLEHYSYFDKYNNLIKEVSIDSSKVRHSYRSSNYVIYYTYWNSLMTKKVKYEDGQFFERFKYHYNKDGLLTEIYRENSDRSVLIQRNSFNKKNLKDTIYGYAFIGNQNSWQAFRYDSLGNIIDETHFLSNKKSIKKITNTYVYDKQARVIEKTVEDSDQKNSLYHWKYIYEDKRRKEIFTESHNDSIHYIRESYYNEKDNLVYSITKKGFSKGRYVKYKYDQSGELISYIERDSPDNRSYRIYE